MKNPHLVILAAGILIAVVTAYCGPISFLGLAVPHLCRGIFQACQQCQGGIQVGLLVFAYAVIVHLAVLGIAVTETEE